MNPNEIITLTGFKELSDPKWPHWKEIIILDEDEALTADMLTKLMKMTMYSTLQF